MAPNKHSSSQQETGPYSCVGTCCGRRINTMLYSNASMPAAAVRPVVQPCRNSTEIVFRRGSSQNMPEPFKSHDGGTLQLTQQPRNMAHGSVRTFIL